MIVIEGESLNNIRRTPIVQQEESFSENDEMKYAKKETSIPSPRPFSSPLYVSECSDKTKQINPALLKLGGKQVVDRDLLLRSIRQGVQLRKVITNDRSGPFINENSYRYLGKTSNENYQDEADSSRYNRLNSSTSFEEQKHQLASSSLSSNTELNSSLANSSDMTIKRSQYQKNFRPSIKSPNQQIIDREALLKSIRAGVKLRKVNLDDITSPTLRNYLNLNQSSSSDVNENQNALETIHSSSNESFLSTKPQSLIKQQFCDLSESSPDNKNIQSNQFLKEDKTKKADERYTSPIPTREMIESEIPTGSAVNRIKLLNSLQNRSQIQNSNIKSTAKFHENSNSKLNNQFNIFNDSQKNISKTLPWINRNSSANKSGFNNIKLMAQKFNQTSEINNNFTDSTHVKQRRSSLLNESCNKNIAKNISKFEKISTQNDEMIKKTNDRSLSPLATCPQAISSTRSFTPPAISSISSTNHAFQNHSNFDNNSIPKSVSNSKRNNSFTKGSVRNNNVSSISDRDNWKKTQNIPVEKPITNFAINYARPIEIITDDIPPPIPTTLPPQMKNSFINKSLQSLSTTRSGNGPYLFRRKSDNVLSDLTYESPQTDQSFYSPANSSQSNNTTQSSYHSPLSNNSISPTTSDHNFSENRSPNSKCEAVKSQSVNPNRFTIVSNARIKQYGSLENNDDDGDDADNSDDKRTSAISNPNSHGDNQSNSQSVSFPINNFFF